ncbi:MAG: DUF3820 family protein [Verrucomicrobiae bacterium]|nr:DUF3820 family protein [Verrucomicrobiae bacterium]
MARGPPRPPTPRPPMTDLDPMPFGKYRGVRLEDVPASYLLWLWNQGQRGELARYIRASMSALQLDDPDTLVDPEARRPA